MEKDIFFTVVCPSLGVLMSTLMYAAPVLGLRQALQEGSLKRLNPIPWAVMTGNCLGWIAYSYHTQDPYIFASNIPGILVSVWLNLGAAKIQYSQARTITASITATSDSPPVSFFLVPQERLLLAILFLWVVILVSVEWTGVVSHPDTAIGVLVNINLLFFYASPLQTMKTVITEKDAGSIHKPTMVMNWINTSFWIAYGWVARKDPVIYGPNAVGLSFGLIQGFLCCCYPSRVQPSDLDQRPLLEDDEYDVQSPQVESNVEETTTPNELV
eukprot:Nitzschia sp. Nitz4//scaffold61_size107673//31588//32495//NITZ4_004229-RA/size107673-snap-gene-0.108-mRNA-1//-1//CDS//3329555692//8996//frame0